MKTLKKLLLFVVASALLAGCTSYKNVPYMQNPEVVNSYREDLPLYDAKIMPKDLLSIESRGREQLQGRSSPL